MFKEQLNMSFDSIRPAPELLDRISAMMSEEVNRKKPPLQMHAVKYAGIAAAVALAAGGTLLIVNNNNSGIGTSGSSIAAEAAETMSAGPTADAAADTAGYGDDNSAAAVGGADGIIEYFTEEPTEDAPGEAAEEAADEEAAVEEAAPEAALFIAQAVQDTEAYPEAQEAVPMLAAGIAEDSEESYDETSDIADTYIADSTDAAAAKNAPEPLAAAEEAAPAEAEAEGSREAEYVDSQLFSLSAADNGGYDSDAADNGEAAPMAPLAAEAPAAPAEDILTDNAADQPAVTFAINADDPQGVITEIPKTALPGETVEIKTAVWYDTDIMIFADGEALEKTHFDSDYWGYTLIMPDHDVTITVAFSSGKQE